MANLDADKISRLKIADSGKFSVTPGKRKYLWLVVLVAATVAGGWMLSRAGILVPSTPVRTAAAGWVYPSQVATEFNASGYVVAQRKAAVASKGTGRIVYLGVQEGSRVKEGEILAKLDNDDLRAEKAQFEAQLNVARFELVRSETELSTAETNFQRYKDLWATKAVSQVDFENARDRYYKGKAAVDSAKASTKAIQAQINREAVLIEYTVIRAPFDGVVLTKDADVGEVVAPFGSATNAKAAVVTMADLGSLMVQADVAESFLNKVRADQPCEVQLDAVPNTRFPGRVHMIVPTADRAKGTVMVKVRFDDLDPRILPEMSAKVAFLSRTLEESEKKPVLGIHRDALATRKSAQGIFRVDSGRAVWVEAGDPKFLGDYLILGPPVQNGERIVLKPPSGLNSGDKVEISE
ncbi:MAG: efflux RND transporter periplasmic adaptor subunit [Desulfobacteraceae bacterium]|nr:efflux RND transporter periplasmic adaptor subunit [Desulfobacteraceae bacterium]